MKDKFTVEIPDLKYYEEEVKCRTGCPVNTDARGYLNAVSKGQFKEAYSISREFNPFASICGKICGAPCEKACRRGAVDVTVSIRNVKGYLTSKHGPESGDLKGALECSKGPGKIDAEKSGKKVAVIGAGCAGLTCAHDLARLGHTITIFEKHKVSGGMLVQGVPINRLSRKVVQAEIDSILELGSIEIKHNCEVGKDISFKELKEQFDAVFIANGLSVGKILPFPNSDHENVISGLKFLLDFNLFDAPSFAGKRSIVIGGGDVAFDVARSALRCKSPLVNLCCLEREHLGEMPGSAEERRGGRREGVVFNDGWGPDKIIVENGQLKGLQVKKVKAVFDSEGRFAPTFEDETKIVEGDLIFMAVGQGSDLEFLKESGVKISDRGIIDVNPDTLETSEEGVYAGGDIAYGPKLFINAVASGSQAALSIHSYLSGGKSLKRKRIMTFTDHDLYGRDSAYLDSEHRERDDEEFNIVNEPHRNSTLEYTDEEVVVQSDRCLECHIHPTFEGNICILCGGCVDVCPSYCLRMVSSANIEGDEKVGTLLAKHGEHQETSIMLFDPLKCIRCGMCSQKCPTGACKMTSNTFEDVHLLEK